MTYYSLLLKDGQGITVHGQLVDECAIHLRKDGIVNCLVDVPSPSHLPSYLSSALVNWHEGIEIPCHVVLVSHHVAPASLKIDDRFVPFVTDGPSHQMATILLPSDQPTYHIFGEEMWFLNAIRGCKS